MTWSAAEAFEGVTESTLLIAELCARIAASGPMTFRDFMEAALYHPQHGYYASHEAPMTREGDYVTSPEVHPIFGALVARQLRELWLTMGSPARFDIVEAGAGRGTLARDILRAAEREPAFSSAMRYALVERSALMCEQQRHIIGADDRVRQIDAMPDAIEGVILSNELLDAFPVHRVVVNGGALREVYVDHDGRAFRDVFGDLSDPAIAQYFDDAGVFPAEGAYAEVNLEAPRWIQTAAAGLNRGYVMTFDYGYEARDLYAPWRRDGTLLCFYGQSASSDPYQRVGRQDLTSSVDLTALRRAGVSVGLQSIAMATQAEFLVRLGIGEAVGAAAGSSPRMEEYFARRAIVLSLIDPGKLGRVRVLLQAKNAPNGTFTGFHDAE